MIVKVMQNLGNRMEKIQETFNKDLEEQKPHSQKDRRDETAEGYIPDEGTR